MTPSLLRRVLRRALPWAAALLLLASTEGCITTAFLLGRAAMRRSPSYAASVYGPGTRRSQVVHRLGPPGHKVKEKVDGHVRETLRYSERDPSGRILYTYFVFIDGRLDDSYCGYEDEAGGRPGGTILVLDAAPPDPATIVI